MSGPSSMCRHDSEDHAIVVVVVTTDSHSSKRAAFLTTTSSGPFELDLMNLKSMLAWTSESAVVVAASEQFVLSPLLHSAGNDDRARQSLMAPANSACSIPLCSLSVSLVLVAKAVVSAVAVR